MGVTWFSTDLKCYASRGLKVHTWFSLQRWCHCSVRLEFDHMLRKTYWFLIHDFWSGQCVHLDLENWWLAAVKSLKIVVAGLQIKFFIWMGRNLYGLEKLATSFLIQFPSIYQLHPVCFHQLWFVSEYIILDFCHWHSRDLLDFD